MIKKPEVNKQSVTLASKRFSRFIAKLPQDIILRYNRWVQLTFLMTGGVIAAIILLSFIFEKPFDEKEKETQQVSSITLSTETIDEVSRWIEEREDNRQDRDSILSRSVFD